MAYRESTTTQGWASRFISIYDVALKPQSYGELVQRYGDGFYILNFLHMAGQTMNVKSETLKIIEEGVPERPVTVSIAQNLVAGAKSEITFSAGDDSDDYARENFSILIPKEYTNADYDQELVLRNESGTWYGYPMNAALTITTALVDVEVIMGASAFGYGTAGADPMTSGYYERSTNARILKDAAGVEGGHVFRETWEEVTAANGARGSLSKELTHMDFRFDSQIDFALLTSQANSNTALTATSIAGGAKAVPSFDGLIPTMDSLSLGLDWDTAFDIDKFAQVKTLLESVGVTNRTVAFMTGTDLYTSIEDSMQAYLNENSAGHNLYDTMGAVGFRVKEVEKNGVKFKLMNLASFSNPNKFGLSSYNFNKMGFMFPEGKYAATLNGESVKLPHLTLGYAVNNTEDRRRVFSIEPGVNGLGYGSIVANSYDGVKFHVLSHIVPIWTHMHKAIKVDYTGAIVGA